MNLSRINKISGRSFMNCVQSYIKLSFNTITFKMQMLEASKIVIKVYANQNDSLSVY